MSNELIYQPDVFAIGQTKFNEDEFDAWIGHNGFDDDDALAGDTPLARLWQDVNDDDALERMAEFGGRHCYRAWDKGRGRREYISNIIDMEHGSVLEHSTINWAIQGISRSLSLELARHRVGIALSQESQRYVDASAINFVVPPILLHLVFELTEYERHAILKDFHTTNMDSVDQYRDLQRMIVEGVDLLANDVKADTMLKKRANEAARALLPNCTETRMLWTTNMRLLRHFIWLRGGSGADLEIRRLACLLLAHAKTLAPSMFADMQTKHVENDYGVPIVVSVDA